MKERLSRMWRSGVALLLALCLIAGYIPSAVFAHGANPAGGNAEKIHYVSLGASNTNGYGIDGYLPEDVYEDPLAASKAELNVYGYNRAPEAAYPAQVAAILKAETGKEVELHQLAISSMRVEEVRYLLDDTMVPDAYMNWRFSGKEAEKWFNVAEPGGVEVLRKAYRESLAQADYVTVDLGWNNFGVFAFNNIKTILADGSWWKQPDFSYYEDKIPEEAYKAIRDKVLDKLYENMSGANDALKVKIELMADTLTAATLGACYNYDIVMEKIYALNPDVTVVVINIQNLADDLTVNFEGAQIALGDLYGELIDLVNLYRASASPYADQCIYADAGDVTTFLDELVAWDGDPASLSGDMQDCFDMYDDSLYVRSIVEYLMAGQALSQVFAGFRELAASYGLEVFRDDAQYTYAFALTRTPEELLSLDLGKLDLNNPAGADADVERYGQALAPHLKNLRAKNFGAYDYVFEALLTELKAQKNALEEQKNNLPEGTPQEVIAQIDAGIATLENAINVLVPTVKAAFDAKLQGVYNAYVNTLDYAYDVVATIFQAAGSINQLTINASSLNGFNAAADTLMGGVANSFIGGAQQKFLYELQKNGLQDTGVTEDLIFTMPENFLADPAVVAVAVLAVRYELGNSFFAHPSPKGHDEITAAVMDALRNGSDAEAFIGAKISMYLQLLKERYPQLYQLVMGAQNIGQMDDLDIIIAMLKLSGNPALSAVDLDALEAGIRCAMSDYAQGKTPEELAKTRAVVYELMDCLYGLAAFASGCEYEVTEDSYYVSLGDSTISGYGLTGYIDGMQNGVNQCVAGSAHVLLAQHLYGDSWKEQFGVFTQGALRAEDLLIFLGGEVVTDDYYDQEVAPNLMEGTLEATQEKFIENVERADLISVAIGGGNVFTFVGKQMNRVMDPETYGAPLRLDWNRIGMDAASMEELNEVLDLLVPIIDKMGLLDQYVPKDMGTLQEPAKFARALAETMLYGYASYNYYYPQVLERIKQINPDAQLLVMGMFNPVDDWSLTTTINGQQIYIPIGGAIGNLIGSANLQNLAFALQHSNTTFVDMSDAETLLEAEKPGGLSFSDYFDGALKSNGKSVHASEAGHQYIFNQMAAALSTESRIRAVLEKLYTLVEAYDSALAAELRAQWEAGGYADAAEALADAVLALMEEATTAELVIDDDFKYVAIGDGTAASEGYAEKLEAILNAGAAENGIDKIRFVNYAKAGNTVADERANLSDVADADLITVGFSNVAFLDKAVASAMNGEELDWSLIVGEENVRYINALLAEIAAKVAEAGIEGENAVLVNKAVEAYAYAAFAYATQLPRLIDDIHAANPDALIVVVGTYNPMQGVSVKLDENTSLEVGAYIDYLVQGVAIHNMACAMLTDNAIYVDAPAVGTANTDRELSILELMIMAYNRFATLYPDAEGDEYIAEQIANALKITYAKPGEKAFLGDINMDGKVDSSDVNMLLRYVAKDATLKALSAEQLLLADGNQDGRVDSADVNLLFRYVSKDATLSWDPKEIVI